MQYPKIEPYYKVSKEIKKYASLIGVPGDKERFLAAIFLNETPAEGGQFLVMAGSSGEIGIGQVMPVWWQKFPENSKDILSDQVRISCQVMKSKADWLLSQGIDLNLDEPGSREKLARMYNGGPGNFTNCPANPEKAACKNIAEYAARLERNWQSRALDVLRATDEKGLDKKILLAIGGTVIAIIAIRAM